MPIRQPDLIPREIRSAVFSPDRIYRYTLKIVWDDSRPMVAFCGLNPSTADEYADDRTVRRCKDFSKSWGMGGMYMMNLFAFRSTDPDVMLAHPQPIGERENGGEVNDEWLRRVRGEVEIMVAAWGTMGTHLGRDQAVLKILPNLSCMRLTMRGHPEHPLYLPGRLKPVPYIAKTQ